MSDTLDIDRLERFAARAQASARLAPVDESPPLTPKRRSTRSSLSPRPSSLARRVLDVEGGGGLESASKGESTLLDTSHAASVETTTSQGSGLVNQQKLLASGKGVYSLHYLKNAKECLWRTYW